LGLDETDLACGAHPPLHQASAAALLSAGATPCRLHNNCSGKHTGMLAAALRLGAPTRGYELPGHDVQGHCAEAIAALAVCQRLRPLLTRAIPWYAVQTLLEMAEAYCDLGEVNAARAVLLDAVEILRHRPDLGILGQRVGQLQAQSAARGEGHSGWEWSLTTAELQLLPLLMTHLTLREIAERRDVSPNTVKTQTTSIYRKLDVSSRSAAVERAAELGLLEAVPV
jgi:DNA-binding CsgD family transcriptional regulator